MDFLGHQGKFCGNYGLTKIKLELKMEGKKETPNKNKTSKTAEVCKNRNKRAQI